MSAKAASARVALRARRLDVEVEDFAVWVMAVWVMAVSGASGEAVECLSHHEYRRFMGAAVPGGTSPIDFVAEFDL